MNNAAETADKMNNILFPFNVESPFRWFLQVLGMNLRMNI